VNVGIDHDTAEFSVESLRKWWVKMGSGCYPNAKQLLITADSGGSNSSRGRLWKTELQKLANETKRTSRQNFLIQSHGRQTAAGKS
jgi:hypothetical protein